MTGLLACARRATAVVAGLNAEPMIRLDGGPSGTNADQSATIIVSHINSAAGAAPFPCLLLSRQWIMGTS